MSALDPRLAGGVAASAPAGPTAGGAALRPARHLLDSGVPAHLVLGALARRHRNGGSLGLNLPTGPAAATAGPGEDPQTLCPLPRSSPAQERAALLARHWRAATVDPAADPPDPSLIDALGPVACLKDGLLPWRRAGGTTVVLTADPERFERLRTWLIQRLGPVAMSIAPAAAIEQAILAARGAALARAAETRVPEPMSCRDWAATRLSETLALALMVLLAALVAAPLATLAVLTGWATLTLLALTALKLAAALTARGAPLPEADAPEAAPPPLPADPPLVSLLVALYGEAEIAPRLVRRLERLDWPRSHLEVLLVVEEGDAPTRAALLAADLPAWMRLVTVPKGGLRTKPRALNHALGLCRGSIVGIYDAEDAPAPDQIARVAAAFAARPAEVACLQGVLDFYNPRSNWISRAFTIEYAAWFRLILPGLAALRLPVPLGGTTVFFRRAALERVGAWDAHNVTEDADLGIRLARAGLRTELIASTTMEEANCRPWPWVKQRSRWIKGYMVTWGVHMRRPRQLWRDLGPRAFWGFQAHFLGSLSQVLLAPLLWSFLLVAAGVGHPLAAAMPGWVFLALSLGFAAAEVASLAIAAAGLRRTGHKMAAVWVLLLPFYFPLATAAAYKALWELGLRPFYWDKTAHGKFDAGARSRAPAAPAATPAAPVTPAPAPRPGPVAAAQARPGPFAAAQRIETSPASIFRRVS
jgi:cellulose synthase/poly-beta-1,6-N-acetylglucosamine synthase-like glycosyltransferase